MKTAEAGALLDEKGLVSRVGQTNLFSPESTSTSRFNVMIKVELKRPQGASFLFLILSHRRCNKMKIPQQKNGLFENAQQLGV